MNRIIAALSLTLLSAGAHADLIFEHDGHTYKLIESTATWEQANNVAEKMTLGGHSGYLARIDSAAENRAIFDIVSGRLSSEQRDATTPNDGSGTAFIWLGGSDAASEGDWRWLNNGDPFGLATLMARRWVAVTITGACNLMMRPVARMRSPWDWVTGPNLFTISAQRGSGMISTPVTR